MKKNKNNTPTSKTVGVPTDKVRGKIAVAMSGGVDSSVVAKMMVDKGYDVIGLFLKLWSDPTCSIDKQNRCCDFEALSDAREVADKLGIKFYVIDAKEEFKRAIVDEFIEEYKKLRTPNPCIKCNEYIKFDLLLKKALEIGAEKLATGHYAQISNIKYQKKKAFEAREAVSCKLLSAKDKTKDQSYMLYRLNQNQLSKVLFPLGDKLKKDVRKLAVEWNLPVKEKAESQEICFFGDRDYRSFLRRYLDKKYFQSGNIVNEKGEVLGTHQGLVNYTIGQRKGVAQDTSAKRNITKILYVIGFNVEKNQLIVGEDKEVYAKEMKVSSLNWIVSNNLLASSNKLYVKIRYRHDAVPCRIVIPDYDQESSNIKVIFDKPQRAITPGQSAVFYIGDEVLGGGIIES